LAFLNHVGKKSDHQFNPDYVPSKFSHVRATERTYQQKQERFDRVQKRRETYSNPVAVVAPSAAPTEGIIKISFALF